MFVSMMYMCILLCTGNEISIFIPYILFHTYLHSFFIQFSSYFLESDRDGSIKVQVLKFWPGRVFMDVEIKLNVKICSRLAGGQRRK